MFEKVFPTLDHPPKSIVTAGHNPSHPEIVGPAPSIHHFSGPETMGKALTLVRNNGLWAKARIVYL